MKRLVAVLALVLALGVAACSPDDGGTGASGNPDQVSGPPAVSPAN
jgi:hypothetical protein